MDKIMGQSKWTTTNHTKGWSLSKESDACMEGLEGSLCYELLLERQTINSKKHCSPIRPTESPTQQKATELSQ